MKKPMCIAFLGGDERQRYAAAAMSDIFREILVWGLGPPSGNIKYCDAAVGAIGCSDAVVLPIRVTTDGRRLNCPLEQEAHLDIEELSHILPANTPVLGGIMPNVYLERLQAKGIRYINYFDREELQIKNALLTAEGALALAITELPIGLLGANAAVLGYGRIGKLLGDLLSRVGVNVTVFARKPTDLAKAQMCGHSTVSFYGDYKAVLAQKFDIIFNTVPYLLINDEILSQMRRDSLVVDLASAPGGVDFESARRRDIKTIWATGLPGKIAPKSAGMIIAETIVHLLIEEEYIT